MKLRTLVRLVSLFSSTCDVLEIILKDSLSSKQHDEARQCILQSFEFNFKLLLMRNI